MAIHSKDVAQSLARVLGHPIRIRWRSTSRARPRAHDARRTTVSSSYAFVSQIQSERRVVPREQRVVADGDDVGAPRLPRHR